MNAWVVFQGSGFTIYFIIPVYATVHISGVSLPILLGGPQLKLCVYAMSYKPTMIIFNQTCGFETVC